MSLNRVYFPLSRPKPSKRVSKNIYMKERLISHSLVRLCLDSRLGRLCTDLRRGKKIKERWQDRAVAMVEELEPL